MNIKKVLFPTDFSHYNDAAFDFATTLAAEAGAVLHIVYVHDVRDLNAAMGEGSYMIAPTWEEEEREAAERLSQIVPKNKAVAYEHHCLAGTPETEILTFAENNDVDLIVMASHGRTGLARLLMGSIAEGVMRRAQCPVLVVKQPASEEKLAETVASHAANNT